MNRENLKSEYLVPSETINNLSIIFNNTLISVKAEEKMKFDLLDKRLSSIEKKLENIEKSITSVNEIKRNLEKQPVSLSVHSSNQKKKEETMNIIITEQMTLEEAKKKVLDFIKKHGYTDISELHSAIKCDVQVLINVVDELIKEGKIKE